VRRNGGRRAQVRRGISFGRLGDGTTTDKGTVVDVSGFGVVLSEIFYLPVLVR